MMAQQAEELVKQAALERERFHGTSPDGEEVEEEPGRRRRVREVTFRNPDAKFVLSEELQTRHVVFSERHVGEIHSFPVRIEEKLEKLGMFSEKYGFQYMRKPHTVIRPHTGLVARRLLAGSVEHMDTKYRRVIVAGEGGTGKSFILMQIAAAALMKGYIVIAVPRGLDLVDNRTSYSRDGVTGRWHQLEYLTGMLSRTRQACGQQLRNMYTTQEYEIGRDTIEEGTPLEDLLELPEYNPETASDVFLIFLRELQEQEEGRPQVLFLFDNISAISVPTKIPLEKEPGKTLHPHKLWLPFFFTRLLCGEWVYPRCAIAAATSRSPHARALDIALGQTAQRPYEKLDPHIATSVQGAEVIKAGDRLTPEEAMGLSSYYKDCGLLKTVDRYDALSKAVGDEDYHYPVSGFWTYNPDGATKEEDKITRSTYDFRRRGKLNRGVLQAYVKRGGYVPLEDPTDYEATMERLALGGGTARGFWKACTRMSHY